MKGYISDRTLTGSGSSSVSASTSEGWYEKLYNMLLGNIPFSLLLVD